MITAGGRRADILEAAAHIVEAAGSRHLTIDAVAQQAGFSKGGVLYHFPSKRALLQGMLERLLEQIEGRTETLLDSLGDGPNARLRARILAERHQSAGERAMARSILAAAAEDPDLLAPARQAVENAFADAADAGEPDTLGWVAILATEGLRFLEMLNLLPLSGNERERVHDQLLRLVETGRP